ncbi:tetratricopeptide repeat protein [Thalassotalea mangrovi]|uniref:Tetratricopeptide repeat protein n=1 Tax=Thalassotalea mangrovi TaxID=2572245 RepID=A0A4V5NWW1_9GAMM|nr:tetratricopeptide repeat protein [Thalassotalea mangrovi]TKB45884.1 tetratricopeptide repeat protein [Thalassotalea mangrovi]
MKTLFKQYPGSISGDFRSPLSALMLLLTAVLCFGSCNLSYASNNGYLGSDTCKDCHQQAFKNWQGSHHGKAMAHANADNIVGNFNDNHVVFNGETYHFFQKDQQYFARLKDANGKFNTYQIRYTFGIYPLQQYMVDLGKGKIQLIPFAWDSRSKAQGGQRWFHLYPEAIDARHEFFWTNQGQNWNYMCADCHSTNVKKNYQASNNGYETSFSEISVGCEACHGPGAEHVTYLQAKDKTQLSKEAMVNKGFDRSLHKLVQQWQPRAGSHILQPVMAEDADSSKQTLVCAQCHSRRMQLGNNDYVASHQLGDKYLLNLVEPGAYHPDGQIYDEVYVYGSFLQSKMHQKGVVCTNCHEPHSGELLVEGNGLCNQCHIAEAYDTPEHHKHANSTAGSQCVDCHMPETTYMQIDARRDHRWHVPNPQQADNLQTPDVCLTCHQERGRQWSIEQFKRWQNDASNDNSNQRFGTAFLASELGYPQAAAWLSKIAQDVNYPNIIRASALQRSANIADNNSLVAIARGLKAENAWIRIGAIRGAENLPANSRWRLIYPLTSDPVLAVRIEAARVLLPVWQALSDAQKGSLKPVLDEYIKVQHYNADRGFALTNLANLHAYQGDFAQAEQWYQQAIAIEPFYVNAYLNFSELYRQQGDEKRVIEILMSGEDKVAAPSALYYQLGLSYIRQKRYAEAEKHFADAVKSEPSNSQYQFVYGLSIKESNPGLAQQAMSKAYSISRDPQHLYALCELQIEQRSFAARQCIERLKPLVDESVIEQLRRRLTQ